jgi:2-amino-4-hydroxy-6-hydroxymethyldihydropteridine diphosphokinase
MVKKKILNKLKLLKTQEVVYLGIGTNKGNREKNISNAINLLEDIKGIKLLKVSKMLKNPPQEGIKNGYFLNGAIKLLTSLNPFELLEECKKIEEKLGRKNKDGSVRIKKSRVIDLDILFYGSENIDTKELIIPHQMIEKRYFVLIPLMEIGKDFLHPALGKSVEELYIELGIDMKKYA